MISIIFCIIVNIELVCSMETYASPIQEEHVNTTTDVNETSTIESAQSVSPDVILEERKGTESVTTVPAEGKKTFATFRRDPFRRIVAIGDLPVDHDPSLVLRKGQIISITSNFTVNSEKSNIGFISDTIEEDIFDESGHNLLIPKGIKFRCAYKIFESYGIFKITVTAFEMDMVPPEAIRSLGSSTAVVLFSSPPIYYPSTEIMNRYFLGHNEEYIQQHEQLFISPAISAELIFEEELKDQDSESEKVTFSKNASGDLTIIIEPGYEINLQVKKDISFSAPYIGAP